MDTLPEMLLDILLSEWNGVKELTKLDTAVCNMQSRKFLLQSYERSTFAIILPSARSHKALEWLLFEKSIKPTGLLTLSKSSFWRAEMSQLWDKLLDEKEHLFSKVKAIKLSLGYRRCESDALDDEHEYIFKLIRFINACPSLRNLNSFLVHNFDYYALFTLMDQSVLKFMTEFSLFGILYQGISMNAVNHISVTCSKITTLEMNICNWDEDDMIRLFCRHATSLTTVNLAECHLTTRLGNTIIECLSPHIKNLSLCTSRGDVRIAKFASEVLSTCKSISNLHLFFQRPERDQSMLRNVKVSNFQGSNQKLFLSDFGHNSDEHNDILTNCCINNETIALTNVFFLEPPKFLSHLMALNPNLRVFSIKKCVLGADSFLWLRTLFEKCSTLHTIHIAECNLVLLAHRVVGLLSSLPRNVTTLLIGKHTSIIDLADLKVIVKSNPFLKTLWFDHHGGDSLILEDYVFNKAELYACGTQLKIIDDLWELECLDGLELI
jgi:hypothetical protein